jgi:hypothetical protein
MVYFPCAWYFNRAIFALKHNNNNKSETTTIATVENSGMEKSAKNDVNHKSNEGVVSSTTVGEENVIIVHENHNRNIYVAPTINDRTSEENETHLAIGILDTVLENEENDDSSCSDIEHIEKSRHSIKSCTEDSTNALVIPHNSIATLLRGENLRIIDPEVIRSEIQAEIDEILERAQDIVVNRDEHNNNNNNNNDEDDENVFQNKKFLTHLSDLISNQSSMSALQSQTLQRTKKSDGEKNPLKHSNSAPNLKDVEKKINEENLKNDDVKFFPVIPPIQPRYNNELLEKFATLREREVLNEKDMDNESTASSEDSVNKDDFRERLEQLLSKPPDRSSVLRPVPMPRISINFDKSTERDEEGEAISRNIPPITPISATLMRQKAIFDEVLRKIKKNEDNENSQQI